MRHRFPITGLLVWFGLVILVGVSPVFSQPPDGDAMIAEYFRVETARLSDACLADVASLEDWEAKRPEYRRQLLEMLGLDPMPERTDLQAVVTGRTEHDEFVVERLHFQSAPGLYVTANLYLPRHRPDPLPAILYVCGHGASRKDGISFGNKATYQHHGGWFARHGFACLTIDTLQMGEIEGIHHGTYRYDMWWWLNRGYTPAGVEAWNCVRALDYLQSRPEIDPARLGVTGRSGGGAYSWWIAAIDERIRAAVPVAGITDLENHVVDGCVEGHCDCMYMVNTYRWDYPLVAALVAPRPLLLSNTDRDGIFPLDGVVRTYEQVRRIYQLYGKRDQLGLQITAGPHRDTQELHIHAFRWMNQHLRGDDSLIEKAAVKFFDPPELKVFETLPEDQLNTTIHETFVPAAPEPPVPQTPQQWATMRDAWLQSLRDKSFRAWPEDPAPPALELRSSAVRDGVRFSVYEFDSQQAIRLPLYLVQPDVPSGSPQITLDVLDDPAWTAMLARYQVAFAEPFDGLSLPESDPESYRAAVQEIIASGRAVAYLAPRGIGPTAWDASPRKQIQHQRRFYLLGQTLDGMRVWDVRRAIQAIRTLDGMDQVPVSLHSQRQMAGVALYAALFEPGIAQLELGRLPSTHRDGPFLLNVNRYLDTPQAVAMAAEHSRVVLHHQTPADWDYPKAVIASLGWEDSPLQIHTPPPQAPEDNGA
jgi:cephalosporin-C deacetylase-like acetyl esterase